MKTSVELDETKVQLAKKLGQVSTIKELLDLALDAYIAQSRRRSMIQLLGRGILTADLDRMRERRGHSR